MHYVVQCDIYEGLENMTISPYYYRAGAPKYRTRTPTGEDITTYAGSLQYKFAKVEVGRSTDTVLVLYDTVL